MVKKILLVDFGPLEGQQEPEKPSLAEWPSPKKIIKKGK
jgi:hypothetical protein